jgi:TPR repeat protein
VFDSKEPMVVSMDKSWFQKLFSRPQNPDVEVAPATTDYGDAEVQFSMGLKFANGEGAAQDFAQAAEWYRKAADQSHSLAQFNLGMMYAQGQGLARDGDASMTWFVKAAQQGDAGAQFNVGRNRHRASFQEGPREACESRIEAYKWYHLAAAQGYLGSDAAFTTLTLGMTREDVAAGDQRVAAFAAEKPGGVQN